ncbi:ATP-dependent RNA helicase [Aphelenchoides fujianensis]|nr:ATP-dependent RNA helicase [Aphelenchoides fujianensis]
MSDAEATDVEHYELLKANQNRKNKKAGGWQSMGARALLLSPTRELALQTFKVVKELGRFTGLRCACLVGGDNMDEQFDAMHQNPDILLATPGRLLHIAVEMSLKLNQVRYVVFDEADRLFEMGFMEQLFDILKRLPDNRQTLLFSATLPKMLIDFVNAGLTEPLLVRLDVDTKLSDKLNLQFFLCREADKTNALLHMLRDFIRKKEQTIVFCATIKHVEYYVALLKEADLDCAYLHSQLDPGARRLNIQRFRNKESTVLVVTDVAARGVDIPLLDNAINVHFPARPKLFVHRVGRVARAGKTGSAFSLITYEELPYVIDFFLFLGRELNFATDGRGVQSDFVIGKYPEEIVHQDTEFLKAIHDRALEMVGGHPLFLRTLRYKSENAMKKYNKTKQPPSAESVRRVKKEYRHLEVVSHPYFKDEALSKAETDVLAGLKNWRPNATIFELNIGSKNEGAQVMKAKRKLHQRAIEKKKKAAVERAEEADDDEEMPLEKPEVESADENDVANAFSEVITGRKFDPAAASAESSKAKKKRLREEEREREKQEHYIAYVPADHFTERALKVDGNFEQTAKASGRYDQWMQKQKVSYADEEDDHDGRPAGGKRGRRWKDQQTGAKVRNERRSAPQIAKERKRKEKVRSFQEERRQKRQGRQAGGRQPGGHQSGGRKPGGRQSGGRKSR